MGATTSQQVNLSRAYAEGGLKGFESALTRQYLECVITARLHPIIHEFLASFIDLRNVMTLYKQVRWQVDDAAAFIPGGTIDASRIAQASAGKDASALDALVSEVAGRAAPPVAIAESTLESLLLGSLGERLRRCRSANEEVGLLLDYIWRLYLHARNRSILLHAAGTDAVTLEKELVA
jgi:vacuolar-type H+-ATPase subunit C/Vma6